jgi:hypothetical protein
MFGMNLWTCGLLMAILGLIYGPCQAQYHDDDNSRQSSARAYPKVIVQQRGPVQAQLSWLEDTLDIGDSIVVTLRITYPKAATVWLVDTVRAFAPFQVVQVKQADVQARDSITVSSTRFVVQSFEVDSVQYLTIPVAYRMGEQPVAAVLSNTDSIRYRQRFHTDPAVTPYRPLIQFAEIKQQLPVWQRALIACAAVLLGLFLIVLLWKPVRRLIGRIRAYLVYRRSVSEWRDLSTLAPLEQLVALNRLWKNYAQSGYQRWLAQQRFDFTSDDKPQPQEVASLTHPEWAQLLPSHDYFNTAMAHPILFLSETEEKAYYLHEPVSTGEMEQARSQVRLLLRLLYQRQQQRPSKRPIIQQMQTPAPEPVVIGR